MLCVHNFNFKSDHLPPKSNMQVQNIQSHIHEIMDVSMRLTVYTSDVFHINFPLFLHIFHRWAHQIKTCARPGAEKVVDILPKSGRKWGHRKLITTYGAEGRRQNSSRYVAPSELGRVSNYLIMFDLCMFFQGITYQQYIYNISLEVHICGCVRTETLSTTIPQESFFFKQAILENTAALAAIGKGKTKYIILFIYYTQIYSKFTYQAHLCAAQYLPTLLQCVQEIPANISVGSQLELLGSRVVV